MNLQNLLFAALLVAPALALGNPPEDCATPRHAVEALFGWLQPPSPDAGRAARCLDPAGRTPEELARAAEQVKEVYDGRALLVDVEGVPDVPDWRPQEGGAARVVVHPGLPDGVVAASADGAWRWTKESIDRLLATHRAMYPALSERLVAHLPASLRDTLFGVAIWQYVALLLLGVIGLVVRKLIQVAVAGRVRRAAEHLGAGWGAKLVAAIDSPGATLVVAGLLAIAYPQLRLPIHAAVAVALGVRLLATLSIVWAAYRLVDVVAEAMAIRASRTDSRLDDQLVPLVRRSLKVVTVIVGALFVLQNLSVDVGSLLAGLGIGGLAFALAAKDTLANLFGSIMIFADKPFQIGDWIAVDGHEGIVEEVGFRSTRVRTFYNSLVTIPNSKLADAELDNYGARRYRRTYTTLNLTYDTTPEQMQAFVEGLRAIIRANPYTRKDLYEVHMSGFGAHSLDVMLYFFFEVPGWSDELRERHHVFLEILRLARELGVQFAFPTQTLHHEFVAAPGAPRQVPQPLEPGRMGQVVRGFAPGGRLARPGGPFVAGGLLAGQALPEAEGEKAAG